MPSSFDWFFRRADAPLAGVAKSVQTPIPTTQMGICQRGERMLIEQPKDQSDILRRSTRFLIKIPGFTPVSIENKEAFDSKMKINSFLFE
jgi:hypothetical protein